MGGRPVYLTLSRDEVLAGRRSRVRRRPSNRWWRVTEAALATSPRRTNGGDAAACARVADRAGALAIFAAIGKVYRRGGEQSCRYTCNARSRPLRRASWPFRIVEDQVQASVRALLERDVDLAENVEQRDRDIDQREVEVEEECLEDSRPAPAGGQRSTVHRRRHEDQQRSRADRRLGGEHRAKSGFLRR